MNFQARAVVYTNLKEYEENLGMSHAVYCMGFPDNERVTIN
jgi:hypothetical protein